MKSFLASIFACFLLISPLAVRAIDYGGALRGVGDDAGFSENGIPKSDILTTIGTIINVALGLLGVVLLVITIYAGFLWMTAQGNEEQVTKAKGMITNAVIGLIITLAAYSITDFVVQNITTKAGGTSGDSSIWDTDPSG